jgi:hypothetical protein
MAIHPKPGATDGGVHRRRERRLACRSRVARAGRAYRGRAGQGGAALAAGALPHGATLYDLAEASRHDQHPERFTPLATQARDEFTIGVKHTPGDLEFVRGLPISLGALASDRLDHKDYDGAIRLVEAGPDGTRPAERGAPGNTLVLSNKQYYYWVEGLAYAGKSSWKEAIDALTARVDVLTAVARTTRLAGDESRLAEGLVTLGSTLQQSGDKARASAQYDRASDAITRALSLDQTNPDTVHEAVDVEAKQIGMLSFPADLPKAFDRLQTASTWCGTRCCRRPGTFRSRAISRASTRRSTRRKRCWRPRAFRLRTCRE